MYPPQLNTLCDAYRNVDKASLHIADPGNTGDDDLGVTHADLTWSATQDGRMTALATFAGVTAAEITHVGLWDGAVFIEGRSCQMDDIVDQDIILLIEHRVRSE
jgi:GrpB-like predicted nucleotidyltransferase (UPF0157 family)